MTLENYKNYFRSQQVSLQWLPVLRALAAELASQAETPWLRALMANAGEGFAKDVESRFEEVQSLQELEEALNEFWSQLNWGWVSLREGTGSIDIDHQAAPLAEAFGDEALPWSVGLLEGFYETIFRVLGAGDAMEVRALDAQVQDMQVILRFGPSAP
jgi:hypothetical protein